MNPTLQQRDSGFCIFMYHPKWVFCSQPTRIREPWISHLPEPLLKTNPWLSFTNHNKTPLTARGLVRSPLSSPRLPLSPATAPFNHPQDPTDAASKSGCARACAVPSNKNVFPALPASARPFSGVYCVLCVGTELGFQRRAIWPAGLRP